MINYFLRMFPYEKWANQQVINTLVQEDQASLDLMMHIQAAKHIWLTRITGMKRELSSFPEGDLKLIQEWNERNDKEYDDWLANQSEVSLEQTIESMNRQRERYQLKLSDLMIQLMNHSTYHRAQIAKNISALGKKPNPTDYLLYVQLVGKQ